MKKKKRIFAGAPSEQAQQTKKEVLSGKCLRTQHDKETGRRSFFKAADGIIAALKKRSALPVHANNPRAAFTLAEVLIALTVIGIVSALTIPTLVQKTNKQEYVSALQKTYSTLSQATNMIIAENGSPKCSDEGWACSAESIYNMYKKYLINAKDCGSDAGCFEQLDHTSGFKRLNGTYTGLSNWNVSSSGISKLILADGVQILFMKHSNDCSLKNFGGSDNVCGEIWADVNGIKKPNVVGRDVFRLVIKENGLYPMGCDSEDINAGCNSASIGDTCTCKVLKEGRMDY